ncbi:MAG: hypothetical protein QG656_465, partial [Candidatus Hydrogenedentes bacterium]|nr:hypothetical protein [Candidatus Hydrogenedentota bacterium]
MVGLNKRPNGMWYVRYVVDGKLVNKSLRTRNPQEAKRRAKEIEDSLAPVQAAEQKAPARQGAGVPSNFPKLAREEQIRIGILAALGRLGNKDIATEIGCVRPALTRFLSGGTMTASLLDNAELWLRSNGFWFWDESGVVDRTEVNKFPEHGDPWDVAMAAL